LSRSSAGNWNNYRRHLRALLQTAIEFKVIKENPFLLIDWNRVFSLSFRTTCS
jgi:hypothetical protein